MLAQNRDLYVNNNIVLSLSFLLKLLLLHIYYAMIKNEFYYYGVG